MLGLYSTLFIRCFLAYCLQHKKNFYFAKSKLYAFLEEYHYQKVYITIFDLTKNTKIQQKNHLFELFLLK